MASITRSERVTELLTNSEKALQADDKAKAASILREASHLEPDTEQVKKRWLALQASGASLSGAHVVLEAIRSFVASGSQDDGKTALQVLKERQLSASDAIPAFELLVGAREKTTLLDEVTALLLTRHIEARRLVATKLHNHPTEVFEQLYPVGDETFQAFVAVTLDASLWTSKEQQATTQQHVFRLNVATLIKAGADRPERAMRAVARQLAVQPENVAELVDEDMIGIILSDLDIRLEDTLRSQAMLSISRILEVTKEKGEQLFAKFVTSQVAKQTNDDLIQGFSAAAAVFPILPQVAAKLFMTPGFVQQLVPNLEKNNDAAAAGIRKSRTLERSVLELLSAACVDKACRDAINGYCSDWLKELSEQREGVHKALASLVLAKIGKESVDDVTGKLVQLALVGGEERHQAIEGLAYTSLQPKIKEELVKDDTLLRSLVVALQEKPSSAFGCLTVLSNLTAYRPVVSEEQKRMSELKAYANSSEPPSADPLDSDSHVTVRCKALLDHNIVSALVIACKQTTSPTKIALVVRIILSLAKEQKHRAKMTQQGAIKLLLQIRDQMVKKDTPASQQTSLIERSAAHALARLLISVNPQHVFTAALPAASAVSALVPLLSASSADSGGDEPQRDLLPTFESLLALTNLASMHDPSARELLIRSSFDKIEDLLFSINTLVQRASVELVCNLIASPQGVALFADGSADSKRRLTVLLALTDVDDLATRMAAGGALAMLTEWDDAVTAILEVGKDEEGKKGKGVKAVLRLCGDKSLEVKHRGLVCLGGIVGAPGEVGGRGKKMVKEMDGVEVVREVLKGVKDKGVMSAGVKVLKQLT